MSNRKIPLIAHVVYRLDIGGLENGLVNLINRLPAGRYRHLVVCLKDFSNFSKRIEQKNIRIVAMHRRGGRDSKLKLDLYRLFRRERPDIVHTRNLPSLDALLPAALAGVRCRIHSEHGRNIDDREGLNQKLRLIRMLHRPLVHHYITVSNDLERYLVDRIGVPSSRITQIYNGVDTRKFHGSRVSSDRFTPDGTNDRVVLGSVLRFDPVKDPGSLVKAVSLMLKRKPYLAAKLRLAMIGDGPLWAEVKRQIRDSGVEELCWLPGARDDIPELLRGMDLFVMPSLAEGISNTILEAMATALPVVATRVGGTEEVVVDGDTGRLVSAGDLDALSCALEEYVEDGKMRMGHGNAGQARIKERFDLDRMVQSYARTYDRALHRRGGRFEGRRI